MTMSSSIHWQRPMVKDPGNVNFPKDLDICPSVSPGTDQSSVIDDDKSDSVFGYPAQRDAIQKYGIAGRVWEASYALSTYVYPPPDVKFDPPFIKEPRRPLSILELGSGAGMASSRIANVLDLPEDLLIVTDLPEVCTLLENNLKACVPLICPGGPSKTLIFVRPLSWGNETHGISIASEFLHRSGVPKTLTHIMCSDLVYFPELLAPLLRTLLQVTSPPFSLAPDRGATVIISYKLRSLPKETPFWSTFGLWFNFEPVLVKDGTTGAEWQRFGASSDGTIFIFTARRRVESFSWRVPVGDKDLLLGKGAKGNDLVKADDTFETLLFMVLENSDT